jgi:hypothetical protein
MRLRPADAKSDTATLFEIFGQSVYQFATTHAAGSFYSQLNAKYRSCRSARVRIACVRGPLPLSRPARPGRSADSLAGWYAPSG